ncbi:EPIDERMAL PATTERNING FACTOR-like protein 2 [Humulus lupulus]|uniref:EPIDERMAL PATTERNING FACTOR-like protein 2 n=1 Tax=Humulus lupulus TaxID=3486 RepID=UPI002B403748|nr:EPIDERMAL PATTERNING FACTOR-like protein 2 [Humulus lupulus]
MAPYFPVNFNVGAVITVLFIFSITVLPPKTVGFEYSRQEERKMVLGSRPPQCVNKCLNCKPCEATLVVPNHQKKPLHTSSHGQDDTYYLLSWRCRCGNKLYHP